MESTIKKNLKDHKALIEKDLLKMEKIVISMKRHLIEVNDIIDTKAH